MRINRMQLRDDDFLTKTSILWNNSALHFMHNERLNESVWREILTTSLAEEVRSSGKELQVDANHCI